MEICVPYGHSTVCAALPDGADVDIIDAPALSPAPDPRAAVRQALAEPVGDFDWAHRGRIASVAIAVNDKTRPVPHEHLLPPLLERVAGLGVPDDAITIVIAVGGHPPMVSAEFVTVIPASILSRHRVVSHDAERPDDLIELGTTKRGTPIVVNRQYVGADLKIVVGTIEPHQFAGFSGGVKTAAIGLAGPETINANHSLMTHPDAQVATYATNPARQDIEEIGALIEVDLALNGIVNQDRQLVEAIAGDPAAVMEHGAPIVRRRCLVSTTKTYGLVIASPGGHPKDINVYQSQKAVAAAARIVRPGGTIVVAAACPEGAGSRHYEEWMAGKESSSAVIDAFRAEGFRVGPHKAFQLARDTERARLIVCSHMPPSLARRLLLDVEPDFQTAVDAALQELGIAEPIAVLPHAASTIAARSAGR